MSPVFDEAKYRALLEKLEISEVKLKETYIDTEISRFDAEFYKKEYSAIEKKIRSFCCRTLKQLNVFLDCSAFYPSVANDYNFNANGIPFLRVNEIIDGGIVFSANTAFLPRELVDDFSDSIRIAHNKDILVAKGGNTAGKVGYITGEYNEYATCRDVVILRTDGVRECNSQTLSLYLQSYFGKCLIEKTISQTGQPHLTLPLLGRLPVPAFSKALQEKIKYSVDLTTQYKKEAIISYNETERLLLQELGLDNLHPTEESIAVKNFNDAQTAGRLDAEYYQPKYDELFERLGAFETIKLKDIVSIKKSIEPGSDAYQDNGIPFIRVSDVSKFGITQPEIYLDRNAYLTKDLIPKKDTILLSKDGSVGIAYKVEEDMDAITSGALLHLTVRNKDFLPDYLTLVLNSTVVGLQAERDAGGSIIQHWKPSEIENVVIPKLPMDVQRGLAAKVQESFALRKESKRLLDLAKRAVELAIEQGEASAFNLLEGNR